MTRVNDVLRLEYCLIYSFPVLIAVYLNQLDFIAQIPLFVAFIFFGLASNMVNDAIDLRNPADAATHERLHGFKARDIALASGMAFLCGAVFLWSAIATHFLVLVFFVLTIVASLAYGLLKGLSSIPYLDQVCGVFGMLTFPYLMVIANNPTFTLTLGDWLMLAAFFPAGLLIQTIQQVIDKENVGSLSLQWVQRIILLLCVVTGIVGLAIVLYYQNLALVPCGFGVSIMFFEFLRPTRSSREVKEILIATGNIMLPYLLFLVLLNIRIWF